jgi:hypothetical protein
MTELARDAAIDAAELLTHYSFDLGGFTVERLIDYWLREYPVNWLRPALVEALYQGRYKAVSVTQILTLWKRRGQPLYHFNHEFERMICGKFPRNPVVLPEPSRSRESDRLTLPAQLKTFTSGELQPVDSLSALNVEVAETEDQPSPEIEVVEVEAAEVEATDRDAKPEPPSEEQPLPKRSFPEGDRPVRALLPAAKPPTEPPPTPSDESTSESTSPEVIQPEGTESSLETSMLADVLAESTASHPKPTLASSLQPTAVKSIESPIQPFKPANTELDTAELVQWTGDRISKHPIHQFVPTTGVSSFYSKLKAVVQRNPRIL